MGKVHIKELNEDWLKCNNCENIWKPRGKELPLICPKCKSSRWDKESKNK